MSPAPATPPCAGSGLRLAVVACLGVLLFAGGLALFLRLGPGRRTAAPRQEPPRDDPRLRYTGPYRNVHPDVRYVGDDVCAGCHVEIAERYAQHPMARTLGPAAQPADPTRYTPAHHNPFTALDRTFRVQRDGGRVLHRQESAGEGKPVAGLTLEVHWAVGSGVLGHSYLTERDGYLYQTPISWFSSKEIWDLSPGFNAAQATGRLVPASCLFCHANQVRLKPGAPDRFESPPFAGGGVGCERCHGPGEVHVRERQAALPVGDVDTSIVHPGRLARELREDVCAQCHLEGEARVLRRNRKLFDYRPGLPLEDFWGVFVHGGGEEDKAVNHVEQMVQSHCFRGSGGGERPLGCVSCHDPHEHVGPEARVAHYRKRCLGCHQEASCSVPRQERLEHDPADSCAGCHMPRYQASDIAHTASTDHRILRRPERTRPEPSPSPQLIDFYRKHGKARPGATEEDGRDLGLAHTKQALSGSPQAGRHAALALPLLEAALAAQSEDEEVWQAKGLLYQAFGHPAEGLAALQSSLSLGGPRWPSLVGAAECAQALGQKDLAERYWRQAVEQNPGMPEYRANLAALLAQRGDQAGALEQCEAWVRLDPLSVPGRVALFRARLAQGQAVQARKDLEVLRQLRAPQVAELEAQLGRGGR